MIPDIDVIIRLVISCLLGGIVGYERQSRNKSAGLRTHILVSLGSCLVMIISINMAVGLNGLTSTQDGARLAAQVVSGIGFLGAGSIMANRQGSVIGLTTAASLWVVAAIGLASGSGFWVSATITTILVYLTLTVLSHLERRLKTCTSVSCSYDLLITTLDKPGQIGKIGAYFGEAGISIQEIRIESEDKNKQQLVIAVAIDAPPYKGGSQIISGLLSIDGIVAAKSH